jgi:hypothetical protein
MWSRLRRRAALFYVLASTYVVARLILSWFVSGVWDLDAEFFVHVVAVTLVQLVALELIPGAISGESSDESSRSGARR